MPEMKINLKGPIGAVIGILVLGGVIYYQFFMPFLPTEEDKKAIREKIEQLRLEDMSRIAKTTVEQYKNTGKTRDTSKEIKDLSGKIGITDIQGKKSFFSGIKVKVTYTIDGKTPETDGGVLYFRIHRDQSENSMRKITDVYQITEDDFGK